MSKIGVKEDNIEPFITDIYNRCRDLGISPENIADHVEDLFEFSKTTIPLLQIPNYIKQKTDEKRNLEDDIERLKDQIGLLEQEKSDLEALRDAALQNERMTVAEINSYSDVKAELRKYGVPVDDIAEFAKTVKGISRHGYDPGKITSEFSDYESHINRFKMFKDAAQGFENRYHDLNQQCSVLEVEVNSHRQTISVFNMLKTMGYGLKELKILWHTINEIALANHIPLDEAPQRFYRDIEEQYDNKLGFESKVENLRLIVNTLSQEESKLRTLLTVQPLVGPVLIRLIQNGVKEQDIINIANLLERNSRSGVMDIQSFVAELDKHGSIKSAIQRLKQEEDKLRKDVVSLQTQKQDLDTYNHNLIVDSVNSKQLIYYYSGLVDSLRHETLRLLSIAALILNYLLNLRFEEVDKLNGIAKFMPLLRADKGEAVPVLELKMALARAIEVIIDKINVIGDKRLAEILSEARLTLTKSDQQ